MDSDRTSETTERNWMYIFSPCIVAIVLLIGVIIYEYATVRGGESRGYVTLAAFLSIPYALGALIVDMVIRSFLKGKEEKARYIWVIESILLICCTILFYYYFLD
jgi:hypothetical protein